MQTRPMHEKIGRAAVEEKEKEIDIPGGKKKPVLSIQAPGRKHCKKKVHWWKEKVSGRGCEGGHRLKNFNL